MNADACFTTQRRVAFRDTDAAGIMHFSVFFVWMEETEHEFLRSRGLSVMIREGERIVGWPRVSATCDYLRPARFEQLISISLGIERIGTKSISYTFAFRCEEQEIARGRLVATCCQVIAETTPHAIPIPADFLAKLPRRLASS